jgi:hypothetical protein
MKTCWEGGLTLRASAVDFRETLEKSLHHDGEKHVHGLLRVHPFAFTDELVESPRGVSLQDLEGEEPADLLGQVRGVAEVEDALVEVRTLRCNRQGRHHCRPLGEPRADLLQQNTNVAAVVVKVFPPAGTVAGADAIKAKLKENSVRIAHHPAPRAAHEEC